jgi:serpin B
MTNRPLALALSLPLALAACDKTIHDVGPAPTPGDEARSEKPYDSAPQVASEDQAALVTGATDFALRLHQQVASGGDGNLIYSPLSISTALAMLYAGARGDTASQMADAIGFTLPQDRLHPAMNWLGLELASRADVPTGEGEEGAPFALRVVNRVWGQNGFHFEPAFLDTLSVSYDAGVGLFDFAHDAENARVAINDWVADQTEQRIRDLLSRDHITAATKVVLTNAVFFTASWAMPFPEARTQPASFQPLTGAAVSVPTMHKFDEDCAFAEGDGYVLAEMPYVGHQVAMTLLVPDAGRFAEVEASLTGARLTEMLAGLVPGALDIALPRFQFQGSLDLPAQLTALGMHDAFEPTADFSGIDGARDLVVSAVVHKAFIKVDEHGTEAAAATAVVIGPPSVPQSHTVVVDRPFLFFLRDRGTGAILFVGRVTNPAQP